MTSALVRPVPDAKGRIAAWWGVLGSDRPKNFLAKFPPLEAANDAPISNIAGVRT